MIIYGKTFNICEDSLIDTEKIEYTPGEGFILPIKFDYIKGLKEQLYQCGFSNNKYVIKYVYVFIHDYFDYKFPCQFCLKYKNEKIKIIPKNGIDFTNDEIDYLVNKIRPR